jgi:hypothetical protein
VTLDAMYWVWLHSQSKGTGRHCLLAVANKAPGADCSASVSTAEFMQWSNAAKSSVVTAVDKLLESGELKMLAPASGSRAAVYALPLAVGHRRPQRGSLGTETGPREEPSRYGNETESPEAGSGNRTETDKPLGPETGPHGYGNRTNKGPETGPLYQPTSTKGGSIERTAPVGPLIPAFANDLVRQMTAAGMAVTWGLGETEWFAVHSHIKRCGVPFMVAFTRDRWNHNNPPKTARYLTRIWQQMPDLPQAAEPEPGSTLPALRTAPLPSGPPTQNQMKRSFFDDAARALAPGETA